MYTCKYCGREFETVQKLGGHVTQCDKNPNRVHYAKQKYDYTIICKRCGKAFVLQLTEKQFTNGSYTKFCCRGCANTRDHSVETKHKISKSLRKFNADINSDASDKTSTENIICRVCGKIYTHIKNTGTTRIVCSKECSEYLKTHRKDFLSNETLQKLSLAGRKSVEIQVETKRSKNEKYFYELCKNQFTNVEHNKPIFNDWDADIIIDDIKVAVLWNGKWHYEKIKQNQSVLQIQNRDKIKVAEIKKCEYIPYVIKDMGKYNKKFVENEFEKFLKFFNIHRNVEQ